MTRALIIGLLADLWRDPPEWLGFAAFIVIVFQLPFWSALL